MVIIIWFIFSLIGVLEFTWLPVFIDAIIASIFCVYRSGNNDDHFATDLICTLSSGVIIFAYYKFFLSLSLSIWWIIASPVFLILSFLVPGFTVVANFLLEKNGLINLPTWALILGIIHSVIALVIDIFLVKEVIINNKNK